MTRNGLTPRNIEEAYRFATLLASSRTGLVPKQYQDQPGDCLIAIDLATQLGIPVTQYMQQTYPIQGRIGMQAKLATSLVNQAGLYKGPLRYEEKGDDPFDKKYRIRAYAIDKEDGEKLYGPWIDWKLVDAEGWSKKAGSKWLTMPGKMFRYRAASWFADVNCPDVLLGMYTVEELEDMPAKRVESHELTPTNGNREKFGFAPAAPETADDDADDGQEAANEAEGEEIPEPQPEGDTGELTASDSEGPKAWSCTYCGATFDEPKGTEANRLCPECLSRKVERAA